MIWALVGVIAAQLAGFILYVRLTTAERGRLTNLLLSRTTVDFERLQRASIPHAEPNKPVERPKHPLPEGL